MKKNIIYLFAHQDDEFGVFIDIYKNIKIHNIYIFYLTNGDTKIIDKSKLSIRDRESIKVLTKLGVKKKNIIFLGKKLGITCNQLYLNLDKVYSELLKNFKKIGRISSLITHSWEGGHEDHDACNLIARKAALKNKILTKSFEFYLYNSYKTRLIFFRVFNPLTKNGKKIKSKLLERFLFISLLFAYKSQYKIWIGLYPFIIFHYLFNGYNFLSKLQKTFKLTKPHKGKLLYEKRKFCKFKDFKMKTKLFISDIK